MGPDNIARIGFLLGTTNSAMAAYMVAGKPEVIANANGNRITLSVAAINKKGDGVFEVRSINNKY